MSDITSERSLLNCRRLPARLNVVQAAEILGFREHDFGPLVAAKLLKPLGSPASNAPKYFAMVTIEEHARDKGWLDRATRHLAKYWSEKNGRKSDQTICSA